MGYSSLAGDINGKCDSVGEELHVIKSVSFDGIWSGPAHDSLTADLDDAVLNAKSQLEDVNNFCDALNMVQEYKDLKEKIKSLKSSLSRCDKEEDKETISRLNREIKSSTTRATQLKQQITAKLGAFSSVNTSFDVINFDVDKSYEEFCSEVGEYSGTTGINRSGGGYSGGGYSSGSGGYSSSGGGYSGGGSSGGYSSGGGSVSPSGAVTRPLSELEDTNGEFVNYYQYNYKQSYGYGTTIASSGCGPTSMAMVLTKLTGKKVTPVDTANWSLSHGHRVKGNGTAWSYFGAISSAYGISCQQMGVSRDNIVNNLKAGKTLIMSMGPGHFTKGGHFIVLRGITEDGRIIVADPNSETRSNQTWDVSVFLNEGKQVWAF